MNQPIKRSRYYHFASIIITLVLNLILNLNLVVNRICLPDFIAHTYFFLLHLIFHAACLNIISHLRQKQCYTELATTFAHVASMLHLCCCLIKPLFTFVIFFRNLQHESLPFFETFYTRDIQQFLSLQV